MTPEPPAEPPTDGASPDTPGTSDSPASPSLPVLREPADGIPPLVDTPDALADTIRALTAGEGPIAVDAERAQSFRYSSKAYLLQLRRSGSGTHLIDPVAFEDADGTPQLAQLQAAMADAEWVIHAASQDLPSLAMAGLVPTRVFDTELAGRLLGLPRVGLGALVEAEFGVQLLKEHSAANWSQRPIPTEWLAYAALDVELLVELRERMEQQLREAGKLEWAHQEFAFGIVKALEPVADKGDRWRRTNGLQHVRSRLGLALVRELWDERDLLAERYDLAPSKVLPDKAITELAASMTSGRQSASHPATRPDPVLPTRADLRTIEGFRRRNARRFENNWLAAIERVSQLPSRELPPLKVPPVGPPNPKSWEQRDPEAWARWNRVRPATQQVAEVLGMPPEQLIQPEALKRITHRPPSPLTEQSVDEALATLSVRPWQRSHLVATLLEGLTPRPEDSLPPG
ncbi:HRDC domain-containing protein [Aestuariimicrobium sp. T2.26MG-19.2B]|uniref:HRDC domain-containing protein n=1 Tax=Aestuariimicrobium sp. T2.26MG-19.2B TaxID=3040679 RepID=UPI002477356F|nr:HRDC domain-containing protein [Aestuariimicrobium sp. T2.26MG-19.2B]CAI9408801.1 Ribonuclease D [Aestuariimicrobium sp. T2.26MG-19.2B]